jgi:hypothetical protein
VNPGVVWGGDLTTTPVHEQSAPSATRVSQNPSLPEHCVDILTPDS